MTNGVTLWRRRITDDKWGLQLLMDCFIPQYCAYIHIYVGLGGIYTLHRSSIQWYYQTLKYVSDKMNCFPVRALWFTAIFIVLRVSLLLLCGVLLCRPLNSFLSIFFGHYIVCPSMTCGFWLPLLYFQTVFLRMKRSFSLLVILFLVLLFTVVSPRPFVQWYC